VGKDIVQSFLRSEDIRGRKHEEAVERPVQLDGLGRSLNDLDIAPLVTCDAPPGIDDDLWTDLDAHDLARGTNGVSEVGKTAAGPAAQV